MLCRFSRLSCLTCRDTYFLSTCSLLSSTCREGEGGREGGRERGREGERRRGREGGRGGREYSVFITGLLKGERVECSVRD